MQVYEAVELPDWIPEWYPRSSPAAGTVRSDVIHNPRVSSHSSRDRPPLSIVFSDNHDDNEQFNIKQAKTLYVSPNANRTVKRKLRGIHIFMITVNGTLGTGLYWRGGQILELAGPLAALLSFLLIGLLSFTVMQCITEMLCIWPIPGALSVYVSEFVDHELGIAVGIAYWFTYSVSFGALIATLAAEVDFWTGADGSKALDGVVIYFLVPLILVLVNATGIEVYGSLEVATGVIKIACLSVIIVALGAINAGAGGNGYKGGEYWAHPVVFDHDAANSWGTAFLMCLSIATFAYVGVEIVAASALESAPDNRKQEGDNTGAEGLPRHDTQIGSTVKFSSMYFSLLATLAYSLSGLLVSFDIPWTRCSLPRLSWINTTRECVPAAPGIQTDTASAFVAIAAESRIPQLHNVFNAFLVFTCVTCASTNLYVASRALFGLTSRLDGGRGQPWYIRLMAFLGRTNSRKVPVRAMIFSALAFVWVPFLQLRGGTTTETPIGMFIEILAQMGSVPVVVVWTCEALAFIRYYHCIRRHRAVIERQRIPLVRRFSKPEDNDYPYRGRFQPYVSYVALVGCLFVLVVANGASLWGGFYKFPFLSSYLFILVVIGVWVLLKLVRGGSWAWVDLSNPDKVVRKLRKLHDIRLAAA
ncbi:Amino acid transporter [Aspergillus mulundensis]|uniref:Amino acid transporter n=1 Tax=Aspergillus mulundensis TaxID=1810919 RepID=A0A3D8SBF7_9EURO|nr:Amino acid transporter [Aspergillus mulundensis]RDW83665.1 Amino acid transporter [Aspergillus mulundensis]